MTGDLYPDLKPIDHITARQRQILILLVRGRRRESIAKTLFVSRSTVNREISAMMSILGATSPEGLGALAYKTGILNDRHLHSERPFQNAEYDDSDCSTRSA